MIGVFTIVAWVLVVAGSVFCVVGAIGLIRFPDFYTRLHAAGVTDTFGAGLLVSGMIVFTALGEGGFVYLAMDEGLSAAKPGVLVAAKLVSIVFFMWVSGTTAVHALAKAAWLDGLEPWKKGEPRR